MSDGEGRPFELRDDLAKLPPYRAPQQDAPVRLNTNESPYPPPDKVMAEVGDAIRKLDLNRYPDRDASGLRRALAARNGWPAEGVWVANGSNEIIQTLMLAFGGPGRRALLFEPTYAMHSHIALVTGTEVAARRIAEPWVLDPGEVAEAVAETDPALTFVCSPNNPTGNAQPVEAVEAALSAGSGLVVVDEAYGDFGGVSALGLAGKHDRVVVVRSFSKSWRLAGARLGYLLSHPWLVEAIQVARLPYHLSATSQLIGEAVLRHAQSALGAVIEIVMERERLAKELARVPGVEVFPSDANFLLLRTPVEGTPLWKRLADGGVLVRDFSSVPGLERCLRVTVGTADQNATFVETLRRVLHAGEEA
ncbi:MAG TPA: histidinol-phosphate transaminase [Actinomycetota bacterium]|nr:histidinol-phosphate transaminase [Actinomycetota bacterium]